MHRPFGPLGLFVLAMSLGLSTLASAQQPTPSSKQEKRDERKDAREEKRDERKDAREEKREERKEAREEAREERKEAREERKGAREERRETRKDRRKDRLKEIRERWGDIVRLPEVRAELKTQAWRMARLNHIKALAESEGKTELVARADKLIERERARHQAAMERLKAKGGTP